MICRRVVFSLVLSLILIEGSLSQSAEIVSLRDITQEDIKSSEFQYSSAVLDQPRGCLKESNSHLDCNFRVGSGRRIKFPQKSGFVFIGDQTIATRTAKDEYYLIEGLLKVEAKELVRVLCASLKNEASQITVVGRSEFYIDRSLDETHIINMSSQDIEIFQGKNSLGLIGSGMQIHFDRPNWRTGKYEMPIPIPFNIETQMVREAKFYEGEKKDFAEVVERVVALQKSAAGRAAQLYKDLVERKLAAIGTREKNMREKKQIRDREDARIRAMFRKRALTVE